ncbi:MAG: DUF86 domain-containing protein [Dehalococcoidia bacterium]
MPPESRKLLWDALQAAARIARFASGRSFDDYVTDDLLRSGIERQFEIIGEALAQLRSTDPDTAELIPNLRQIVAFRNILAHGYASVNDRTVWQAIHDNLGGLTETLRGLLPGD